MAKPVRTLKLGAIKRVTIPSDSEVNAAFMQLGDKIQQRHIEAFKRLADR